MKKHALTICLILNGFLFGCGGGGGGGNGDDDDDFEDLRIDAANAVEVAGTVINAAEGVLSLGGVASAPITATRVAATRSRVDFFAFSQRLGALTVRALQGAPGAAAPATLPPSTFDCASGNATLVYNDVTPIGVVSPNDMVFIVFNDCSEDGIVVSGQVDVRILDVDSPDDLGSDLADWSLEFRVTLATNANNNNFAPLRFTFENETFDVTGTWTSMLSFAVASATTTTTIDAFSVGADADGDRLLVEDYLGIFSEDGSGAFQLEADFTAQPGGILNYLCVDTQQAFEGVSPGRPGTGQLVAQTVSFDDLNPQGIPTFTCADLLTGLIGSSRLTLTVTNSAGPDAVQIDVDSDLDGVTDSTITTSWDALDS